MLIYTLWDKWYNITGTWEWHVLNKDPAVDFGLPKNTVLYTGFAEQRIEKAEFNRDGHYDKLGVRKYVRIIELKDGKPTGYEVQLWHISKMLVKNGIYKGRVPIALSGNTGAAGAPKAGYHCHVPYYVNGVRQDITLVIFELFMPGEIKKLQDQIDFYKNSDFDKAKQIARLTTKLDAANDQITELKSRLTPVEEVEPTIVQPEPITVPAPTTDANMGIPTKSRIIDSIFNFLIGKK